MKRIAPLFFLLAGAAAFGQSYNGYLDAADCSIIAGWAWDANQPNTPSTSISTMAPR